MSRFSTSSFQRFQGKYAEDQGSLRPPSAPQEVPESIRFGHFCVRWEPFNRAGAIVLQYSIQHFFINQISTDKKELAGLHIRSRLHPVQVYPACELAPIEPHLVVPSLHVTIDELCHLLAEGVED